MAFTVEYFASKSEAQAEMKKADDQGFYFRWKSVFFKDGKFFAAFVTSRRTPATNSWDQEVYTIESFKRFAYPDHDIKTIVRKDDVLVRQQAHWSSNPYTVFLNTKSGKSVTYTGPISKSNFDFLMSCVK